MDRTILTYQFYWVGIILSLKSLLRAIRSGYQNKEDPEVTTGLEVSVFTLKTFEFQ
jgi:hypothetical protein